MRVTNYEHSDEGYVVYQASVRRFIEVALVNGSVRVFGPSQGMPIERELFRAEFGSRQSITSLRCQARQNVRNDRGDHF